MLVTLALRPAAAGLPAAVTGFNSSSQTSRLKTLLPFPWFSGEAPVPRAGCRFGRDHHSRPPRPGDAGPAHAAAGFPARERPGILRALSGERALAVETRDLLPAAGRLAGMDGGCFRGAAAGGVGAGDWNRATSSLSVRGLVLVRRDAGSVHRADPGGRAGHGGSFRLSAADRTVCGPGLDGCRIIPPMALSVQDRAWRCDPSPAGLRRGQPPAGRLLAKQHHAV